MHASACVCARVHAGVCESACMQVRVCVRSSIKFCSNNFVLNEAPNNNDVTCIENVLNKAPSSNDTTCIANNVRLITMDSQQSSMVAI